MVKSISLDILNLILKIIFSDPESTEMRLALEKKYWCQLIISHHMLLNSSKSIISANKMYISYPIGVTRPISTWFQNQLNLEPGFFQILLTHSNQNSLQRGFLKFYFYIMIQKN